MNPRARSIEDVNVKEPNKAEDSYLAELMCQCITEYKRGNKELSKELKDKVVNELFERYNFSEVGDSNSTWGRQHRLICSYNVNNKVEQKRKLEDIADELGFIVQSVTDPHSDPSDSYIFVPDLGRYISYNHKMNIPNIDVIISVTSDYTEIKSDVTMLNKLTNIYDFDEERVELSVIRENNSDDFVEYITDVAEENDISYVLSSGLGEFSINREWHPDLDEYVALLDKPRRKFKAHAVNSEDDSKFNCGSNITDKVRVLPKERVINSFEDSDFFDIDWCGHSGCKIY